MAEDAPSPPPAPEPPAPEPPAEKPKPLLVVKGADRDRVENARMLGCFVIVLIAIGTVVGGSYALPAISWRRLPTSSWRLLILVGMAGAYVAERFVRPRAGTVEFWPDEITFLKERGKVSGGALFGIGSNELVVHEEKVRWTDVVGFKDDKAEFVAIVKKGGGSSFLTVPTLREEDRVAVLKLLDEKGVPRVE